MKTYKHPLPHYAKTLELSLSTVKRYARKGYDLDSPHDLSQQLLAQKNRPQGRSYRGAFGPAEKPNKRGLTSKQFTELVMAQTMHCKIKRFLRKAEVMVSCPSWVKNTLDARAAAFNFLAYLVVREVQLGIVGILKASRGYPLQTLREERLKADADFRGEEDSE